MYIHMYLEGLGYTNVFHCLKMFFFMFQKWTDPHLVWNTTEYGGLSTVRIPSPRVWVPDIVLYNRYIFIIVFIGKAF